MELGTLLELFWKKPWLRFQAPIDPAQTTWASSRWEA